MALYRCASCGSPNVKTDSETSGVKYNYVKGAIGTAVLGAGGAVAGIENKTKQVFKCPDCGLTLSYPLGEPYKSLIDIGVSSLEGRKTLNINGFPMSWENIVKKFPNIESGCADLEAKIETEARNKSKAQTVEYLLSLWQKDNIEDMEFLKKTPEEIETAQREWEENKATLTSKREKHFKGELEEAKFQIPKLEAEKAAKVNELEKQIANISEELKNLQSQLSSLGAFKFSEKAKLKKAISEAETKITSLKSDVDNQIKTYNEKIEDTTNDIEQTRYNLNKKLDVIYAVPESPRDKFNRLKEEEAGIKKGSFPITSRGVYIKRYYIQLLIHYGKATDEDVKDIFDEFMKKALKTDAYITKTVVSPVRRYYEPFLNATYEGVVLGEFTPVTVYYEYVG